MAEEAKKVEPSGFHSENTVEITINGEKRRVNKYEAEALKKKLSKQKE